MTEPNSPEKEAADWLAANWEAALAGGALVKQLRDKFGLSLLPAVRVISAVQEARRK